MYGFRFRITTMKSASALFDTVARQDYLGFWADQTLQAKAVADFLSLGKQDVAKVAGVSPASVRFDQKIPKEVLDRLQEIANICSLVASFFDGDAAKTALWFKTKNPSLGGISPRDMIRFGRYSRLQKFVMDAIEQNLAAQRAKETKDVKAPAQGTS
jgi:hypothetical protein